MNQRVPNNAKPVLVASVSPTGAVIDCHFPHSVLLHYSESLVGQQLADASWWSQSDQKLVATALEKARSSGLSHHLEALSYRVGNDEPRTMELWVHPLGSAIDGALGGQANGPTSVCCICTDNTDQSNFIESLTLSEARFRSISHSVPALIWMHDSQGQHEFANQTFCDFFGVTQEDLAGDKWQMLVHPEDADYAERFYTALKQRLPFNSEVRVTNAQGELRTLESFATPHFSHSGAFTGYIGVTVDITERQAALQRLTDSVQQKNVFLATLAHELRNPLLPIVTGTELLKLDDSLSSDAIAITDRINNQSARIIRLVDDILDINRFQKGEFNLKPDVVDIKTVIKLAIEASVPDETTKAKSHNIKVICDDNPPPVWGDEVRLIQALNNVIANAVRYSDQIDDIILKIQTHATTCVVEVIDNGQGIAAKDQHRIFELYYGTNNSAVRGEINLGIGLWLTKSIVEKHGGTVTLVSEGLDTGTTVTLTLPLATPEQSESSSPIGEKYSNTSDVRSQFERVLIVEDNPDVAAALAKAVERFGAQSHIEHTASSIVQVITDKQPDLVIMDIGLPDIDGITAVETIHRLLDKPAPLLVALTGLSDEDEKTRALAAGFDHYLVKPITLSTIKSILTNSNIS